MGMDDLLEFLQKGGTALVSSLLAFIVTSREKIDSQFPSVKDVTIDYKFQGHF